jgi:hypothetical protein
VGAALVHDTSSSSWVLTLILIFTESFHGCDLIPGIGVGTNIDIGTRRTEDFTYGYYEELVLSYRALPYPCCVK